ncbi:MAG: GIY-YIG nuclease family protein [Gemmatimonadota bacterium]|nr:GIY-YIG nuclease family protein [Gemmatimonadota bacterium]
MSIVYAARNPAMPGLIKIGRTDREADARLSQLYTTGVPVPFKCVMAVKPERSAAEVERALHQAFEPHRLNPAREFFEVEPENVRAIMRLLGEDVTDQVQAADDRDTELTVIDRAARERADQRRPDFNFKEMGIEPGTELRFRDDVTVTAEVVDERRVRIDNEIISMTEATKRARKIDYAVAPMPHWRTPDGRLLSDVYSETYSPAGP